MDTLAIIKRIEMRLSEIGMSKADFYQKSGISSASLSQWRTGTYKPSLRKIENAAKALGVSSDYLISGSVKSGVTTYQNGISVYYGNTVEELNQKLEVRESDTYQVVYRAPGILITVDNNGNATDEQINSVIALYNTEHSKNKNAPTVLSERNISDDDIKFALFGGDGDITDAMYEEVRRFAAFVKQREADKKE